jgi:hypothetical protein
MNIERVKTNAMDPSLTREDLEQMLRNARERNNIEAAKVINDELHKRFPARARDGGGKTPTEVTCGGRTEHFDSGKDGYLWLVEQFRQIHPSLLTEFIEFTRVHASSKEGRRFAKDPNDLFPQNSTRRGDRRYFDRLTGGWYADINISHDDKFAILMTLAHICQLHYGTDWDFKPIGSSERLRKHQATVVRGRQLLMDFIAAANKA